MIPNISNHPPWFAYTLNFRHVHVPLLEKKLLISQSVLVKKLAMQRSLLLNLQCKSHSKQIWNERKKTSVWSQLFYVN